MTNKKAFEIVLKLAKTAHRQGFYWHNDQETAIEYMESFKDEDIWPLSEEETEEEEV